MGKKLVKLYINLMFIHTTARIYMYISHLLYFSCNELTPEIQSRCLFHLQT